MTEVLRPGLFTETGEVSYPPHDKLSVIRLARSSNAQRMGIEIGKWKASQASGNAIVLSTAMCDAADTTQLDVFSVFGETVTQLGGGYSAKVIRGRHLITATADTDFTQETYGIMGQLVIKNASLNHYHSGIMGTFETSTLCHVVSGYSVGAISARLGGSGTTVASGGLLAGVSSIQHMSAFTNSGTIAAFATHKTATGIAWPTGIHMQPDSVNKILVAGTGSGANAITDDTASVKFMQVYCDCGATSGTSVGFYIREYLTGTGGSNAVVRIYSDVSVAAATAQGLQCSMGFGESTTSGSVSGLGVAGRFQIGLASCVSGNTGTIAAVQSEIYCFGANSDPGTNRIAFFRVCLDGNTTGMNRVDDYCDLFNFAGLTEGDGNMLAIKGAGACPNVTHSIRINTPSGVRYLYAGSSPLTA